MTPSNGVTTPGQDKNSNEYRKQGFNLMMDGVRWTERYSSQIEQLWKYIPNWLHQTILFSAIFLLASGIQGNWILMVVHFFKHLEHINLNINNDTLTELKSAWPDDKNGSILFYIATSAIGSYTIYFGIGGFLYWYYYVHQRDKSHEWKCQPEKYPEPELARHEVILGSITLFVLCVVTGIISWYAANDGKYLTIYYRADEYGWFWLFAQIPITFLYQDYHTYFTHRFYHLPMMYKTFHKMHHKYKQPTPFSVTAMHPLEAVHLQLVLASPIVLFPVHYIAFYSILIYTYIHGILDHSGITIKSQWWQPWQPDTIFHDNHHQYFHVNYGFNCYLWDKIHGTSRKKDRVYTEDIFYGKGKALNEVPPEVLANDIAERKSENPLAYRNNQNVNELTEKDLK